VQIGWIAADASDDPSLGADAPSEWLDTNVHVLSDMEAPYWIRVFARVFVPDACVANTIYSHLYEVQSAYPAAAGQPDSTALHMDDDAFVGWAVSTEDYIVGTNVSEDWQTPDLALGQAVGSSGDIVCLGDDGSIELVFSPTIRNGEGWDFAVFENSFNDTFLEIGYVEVSSDGENFIRFDNAYLGTTPVAGFGAHDTSLIGFFGGKYRQGYGNPFDLQALANKQEVIDGIIDLNNISHVRIVDIIGDGLSVDSFGQPIYDPHPTSGSAGFDLDAVGVINSN